MNDCILYKRNWFTFNGVETRIFVWYLCFTFRLWGKICGFVEPVKKKKRKKERNDNEKQTLVLWSFLLWNNNGAKFYQCPISFLLTTTLHNVVIRYKPTSDKIFRIVWAWVKMTKEKISSFVSCQKGLENDSFPWFPVFSLRWPTF